MSITPTDEEVEEAAARLANYNAGRGGDPWRDMDEQLKEAMRGLIRRSWPSHKDWPLKTK